MLLLLAMPAISYTAEINVKTDREPVALNESFRLIFETEGSVDGDPDFSPLDTHFRILSTSQSSNISLINGSLTTSKQWNLVVLAKEAGTISIPPISFGKDKSLPARIKVTDAAADPDGTLRSDNDIFLEVTASPPDPYVQSQVIYTLKLYRSVAIANASLADPEVIRGDALIRRIDDDKSYDERINGRTYRVVERNFAIFPQSSGELSIAPINFMGQVARSSYTLMDPFGPQPRTVIRKSQPVTLDVQPVPATFTGDHWLPAKNLTVAEEWSTNPAALQAGEPVTRTLILTATGLSASQLPDLPGWNVDGLKYYPDQPALTDDKSDAGITGTRRERAAIIPNQAGEYVLPAITIPWWNVTSNRLEYAEIPERHLQVQAAVARNDKLVDSAPALPVPRSGMQSVMTESGRDVQAAAGTAPGGFAAPDLWKWASIVLAVAWALTLLLWMKTRQATDGRTGGRRLVNASEATRAIIVSCKTNDPVKTRDHLLHWARQNWPDRPPMSLGEMAVKAGPELARELRELNRVLYSHDRQQHWSGETFLQAFRDESARHPSGNKVIKPGKLEPLYRI